MMKKYQSIILCIMLTCLSFTGCSKTQTVVDVNNIIKPSVAINSQEQESNDDSFVLTLWSNPYSSEYIKELFNEIYPKAQINVEDVAVLDIEKTMKAFAAGDAPDVFLYSSDSFGNFNAIDGFEDLSQEKYNVEDIKGIFSQRELDQCMSIDNKKLLALPFTECPMVTYYRTDILEQHGILTDPTELGDFMESPEGWMTIAKGLMKDNVFALQWKDEFFKIALKEFGFFDKDMNLKLHNEKIKETLDITKEIYDLNLMSNYNIWDDDVGKQAVKDGKIAMLYLNKWGEDYIKQIAPETAGKWRATRLPLGLYGYSDTNYISISASSKYKEQAWELSRKYMVNDRNYIASLKDSKNEFLGGQKSQLLYGELGNKLPRKYPTMLDDEIYFTLVDRISNNINDYTTSEDFLNSVELKINSSIYHKQKALSEYIKENRK